MKIMKLLIIVICMIGGLTWAVDIVAPPSSLPEAMITAKVINEEGSPLAGLDVTVVFDKLVPFKTIESVPISGKTDEAGKFTARGSAAGQRVGGSAEGPGYYRSTFASPLLHSAPEKKWEPWNPTIEVVVKKIEKPIPMYAKKVDTDLPLSEQPIGFDLAEGDWVAPHGRGKTSDLIFKLQRRFKDVREYESSLEISFSSKADGIQAWDDEAEARSALKLPRAAPENGYVQLLLLSNKRVPGAEVERDVKENRNYFFRVRTVLDPKGKVVSALYGKINGVENFDVRSGRRAI